MKLKTLLLLTFTGLIPVAGTLTGCMKEEKADHCTNAVKDEDETGVDCGGSCPDSCYLQCNDGIMNGNELGIDCGGDCGDCSTDVYICGFTRNAGGKWVANYWKNNTEFKLTDGSTDAVAQAIRVVGTDVYVCGYETNAATNKRIAKYWKNGVGYNLTDGTKDAYAFDMMIVNNDVYICGGENENKMRAKYWKNGVVTALTDGSFTAFANCIFVSGNDVYVSGSERTSTREVAKYWKNGVEAALNTTGTSYAYAYGIAVGQNGDLHICGPESENGASSIAKYWKNGTATTLDGFVGEMSAFAVRLWGNDVYVCGTGLGGSGWVPCYWKNGVRTDLTGGGANTTTTQMWVTNGDVYVTGPSTQSGRSTSYQVSYWKNGVINNIAQSTEYTVPKGIFVHSY